MNNTIRKYFHLSIINYIRARKLTELYQPTYNNNNYFLVRPGIEKRHSDDRLDLIMKNLPTTPGSYLDVGSQLGYFVYKMAEKGFLSCGMEMNSASFRYASSLAVLNNIKNVSFLNLMLDEDSAASLPQYDVVSILSVYHHMVYFLGRESADKAIKILISKCNKTFFFETGEYEEKGFYWTEGLSFMGDKSSKNIKIFLEEFGFSSVQKIGEHKTHLTSHKRSLFMCNK
jgi:O-antigen chain-terminating methyltransferase